MRRCTDLEIGATDPDIVEEILKTVCIAYSSDHSDALWHLHVSRSDEEVAKSRRKGLMFLARYARQPLEGWDDIPITEIDDWIEELVEVLKAEHPLKAAGEEV